MAEQAKDGLGALSREDREVAEREGTSALAFADRAGKVVVASQGELDSASAMLKEIKARSRALEEARLRITKPMNVALREANNLFRDPADALKGAERKVKAAVGSYLAEVERKRAAAEEEARRKAEKERRALEARAKAAEKSGREAKATALRELAATVEAPEPEPEAEAPRGVSTRQVWKAEVTDLMKLIKAVAAGKAPLKAVLADMKYLNATARSERGGMKIAGVRAVSESVVAVGE